MIANNPDCRYGEIIENDSENGEEDFTLLISSQNSEITPKQMELARVVAKRYNLGFP